MSEPTEAQIALIAGLKSGTICDECAEDLVPGEPCQNCADKRELLRQVFPEIHGDS